MADGKSAAADALQAKAERLRPEAAVLRSALEPLVGLSSQVWVGPAAAEFEKDARSQGRLLDQQADGLIRIAGELVVRSGQLRREAARLRAQATAAEGVPLAAAPFEPRDIVT